MNFRAGFMKCIVPGEKHLRTPDCTRVVGTGQPSNKTW